MSTDENEKRRLAEIQRINMVLQTIRKYAALMMDLAQQDIETGDLNVHMMYRGQLSCYATIVRFLTEQI